MLKGMGTSEMKSKRKELTPEQKAILKKWGLPEDLKEPVSVQIEGREMREPGGTEWLHRDRVVELARKAVDQYYDRSAHMHGENLDAKVMAELYRIFYGKEWDDE